MKNTNKKLSVIIPGNDSKKINDSLISLKNQSYKDMEIIIVSNDEFEDDNVINMVVDDESLYKKILKGLNKANGEYISILLPGNTVGVDLYRSMIFKMEQNKSDIVMSNYVFKENEKYFYHSMTNIPLNDIENNNIFSSYFKNEGLNPFWNKLDNRVYSSSLIKKILKDLNKIDYDGNIFLILDYYIFKNAKKLSKIENDVLFENENIYLDVNLEDVKKIFEILDNIIDNDFSVNYQNWKNYYSMLLKCDSISFNPDYKEINKKDFYTLITNKWDDGLENIKKNIMSNKVQVVSFDIFDTLILRPFLEPTDLFDIVDKYFRKLTNNRTATEFKNIRVDSELCARKNKSKINSKSQDVTLDEIYDIMQSRYRIGDEWREKLQNFELEQELRFCYRRNTGFDLFELSKYIGKKVICTSDMYLPYEFLLKMLKKNGYEPDSLYVSCVYDKTKASGDLYKIVSEKENVDFKNIIHIGDNIVSDIQNANKYGIKSFQLRKPTEIFFDSSNTECLSACYSQHLPFWMDNSNGLMFNGVRIIPALVANKYFDNPFRPFLNKSDYNADPYLIGYYCLGSYMYGVTRWMLDEFQNENYDKIVFMARDGYLPMECYNIMKNNYKKQPKSEYLYISRKALIPIIIQSKMDFYKLPETLNIEKNTPLDIANYVKNLIDFDEEKLKVACEKVKLNYKHKLKTMEEFNSLIDLIINEFYNQEKHHKNLKIYTEYYKNIFGKNSATFDIGYSARPSYFISNLLEEPIDTYFCNINHNQGLRHADMGNFKLKTFFEGRPCTTGHAYELLVSASAPSCIAYDIKNGKVVEKFEEYLIDSVDEFAINTIQNSAIDFVRDVSNFFGEDLDVLYYQNHYVGLPFLAFMNSSREIDKYPFSSILFEDNLAIGKATNMIRVWQDELMLRNQHTIPSLLNVNEDGVDDYFTGNRLVYNSNIDLQKAGKFKRLLFYLLYDKDTFKRRIDEIKHHFWNKK